MISVIICSVNPDFLKAVSENIAATISVPYELVTVDNRKSNYGICKVYNEAAAKANYDLLCFVHEDVRFHTTGWGQILATLLSDESVGLVGVSGSVYKSKYPGTWAACSREFYRMNTLQHYSHCKEPVLSVANPFHEKSSGVTVIDGVFMVCRKATWQKNNFDEVLLKGFHGYDLDWSLAIGKKYKILVTHDILLEHFSEGSYTKDWIASSFHIHRKWRNYLPKNIINSGKAHHLSDYLACSSMLQQLLVSGSSKLLVLKYYLLTLFLFFKENKFRFTKTVTRYLFFNHSS